MGSVVACRTRSVTLPIAQRSSPPRPWVAIAMTSQPPNTLTPSASPPFSAPLMIASAASVSAATDHVTGSLRSAIGCATNPSRISPTVTLRYRVGSLEHAFPLLVLLFFVRGWEWLCDVHHMHGSLARSREGGYQVCSRD